MFYIQFFIFRSLDRLGMTRIGSLDKLGMTCIGSLDRLGMTGDVSPVFSERQPFGQGDRDTGSRHISRFRSHSCEVH